MTLLTLGARERTARVARVARRTICGMLPFDTSKPNAARVYDYMLGGKDNFAADRELAERMLQIDPGLPKLARSNREFVAAVVARAAGAGIRSSSTSAPGCPPSPRSIASRARSTRTRAWLTSTTTRLR